MFHNVFFYDSFVIWKWGVLFPVCTLYKKSIFLTSCVLHLFTCKTYILIFVPQFFIHSCYIFLFTQLRNKVVSIPILKMLFLQYNINVNVYYYYCMCSFSWYLLNYLFIGHSGFPGGSVVKNPPASTGGCRRYRRCSLDPWVRISPKEGNSNLLQYSCLENPMDRGGRWAVVHEVTKSFGHN